MRKIIWLFLLSSVTFVSAAQAQVSVKPEAALRTIPGEGRAAENFLPKGWEIVSRANGDLNGDGLPDLALTLGLTEDMQEMLDNSENSCEAPPYIILVLFARQKGGYERFAANGKLYPSCENAAPALTISKGVLVSNQNYRDGWALDITYRFRYDAAENKLMLIGFDYEHYSRSRIDSGTKTSENYLTGQRIEYAKNPDNRYQGKKVYAYRETGRKKIDRVRVSFEDTKFREVESDDEQVRPF